MDLVKFAQWQHVERYQWVFAIDRLIYGTLDLADGPVVVLSEVLSYI